MTENKGAGTHSLTGVQLEITLTKKIAGMLRSVTISNPLALKLDIYSLTHHLWKM